ncbi:MAG TPA: arylsulfatase, partial [Thermoguttaceae bacterium]|nr:arylsulfatase [Thermoguttaceae bacterium]
TIDGRDIWPLMAADKDAGPVHDVFYFYQMDQLQAVRSGKWKLCVALDDKKRNWGKSLGPAPLRLYDLQADIAEENDVSAQYPEVVERLQALADAARDDLGDVGREGKGQRPSGWVDNPVPLLMEETE